MYIYLTVRVAWNGLYDSVIYMCMLYGTHVYIFCYANPKCVSTERLCPTVNLPTGSVLLNGAAPYTPGTTLQYGCAAGFELTGGHLERLCKLDGFWAGEVPRCTGNIVT